MKHLTFIILCLILSHKGFSQLKSTQDITWGPTLKEKKGIRLVDVIGHNDQGTFILKNSYEKRARVSISKLDDKLIQSQAIPLTLGKNEAFESARFLGNNLIVLSNFLDKKQKTKELHLTTINQKNCIPNRDKRSIASINYEGFNKKNSGLFAFENSKDKSKLLVYYQLPYEKGTKEKFGFSVINESLSTIWNKEVTLPYEEELFSVYRIKVDHIGNVYVLGKRYFDKRATRKLGEVNYEFILLRYDIKEDIVNEYPIQIRGKYLHDMQIDINKNLDLICAGFYSEKGLASVKGSFFMRIDGQTKATKIQNTKEFPFELMTKGMSNRETKKVTRKQSKGKNIELYEYDLDELIVRDDGGVVLIGEQYFVNTYTYTYTDPNGFMRTSTVYEYNYNNIIVVNINPDGSIAWSEQIVKKQSTRNDGGINSSYEIAIGKDRLYFMFNDHSKNIQMKKGGVPYVFNNSPKTAIATLVEMNLKGLQKRTALFTAKEAEVLIRPKVCEQITKDQIIIFGKNKKKQKFARLKLY